MIYKVYYQETKDRNPKRAEQTHSCTLTQKARLLHRRTVEQNTPYKIEFIQELDEKLILRYEKRTR